MAQGAVGDGAGEAAELVTNVAVDSARDTAPPSVLPILKLSKSLSQKSEGLFNPAIGHLYRAWGFHGRPAECLNEPNPAVIDTVVDNRPSMDDVHIDGFRIWSTNDTVKLDFRGIQRGFAVDQAAEAFTMAVEQPAGFLKSMITF